jgi:hypothetical protein
MKKRLLASAGIVAVCVGVLLAVVVVLPGPKAAFDRVEVGMAVGEVESIFGMPPTDIVPILRVPLGLALPDEWPQSCRVWRNKDGSRAEITFVHQGGNYLGSGTVYSKEWQDSTETTGETLRRWVRWPWW